MTARLLQPLTIRSMLLNSRLVMPPMATAKAAPVGTVSPEILAYYREKAAGGYFGLIVIEHSYVSPEGKASARQLSAAEDGVVPGLRELAQIIHAAGTKAVVQLSHAGSATTPEIIGTTPLAPSPILNPRKGSWPTEMEAADIARVVEAFAQAAHRCREAGFDGVEIHSAHGYLLNQFYSPLTNQRTDEYGGDWEGRIRIHLEIIRAVRSAVGPDFPIFLRLGASDFRKGGTTIEDSKLAAIKFVAAGVDVIDVSGGFCGYVHPEDQGQGYFAGLAEAIRGQVSVPVILTGGVTEAAAAERLLHEGKADLIGVGRAVMADSGWAQRAVESLR